MQVNCESPVIILNKALPRFVLGTPYYMSNGRMFQFNTGKNTFRHAVSYKSLEEDLYRKLYAVFNPKRNRITADNAQDTYFINLVTSEVCSVYQVVACGKCNTCLERKRGDFASRCELETAHWRNAPIFVTLTYNEQNCPKEVCVRDCQLFMKSLRRQMQYHFPDADISHLRYTISSEYGTANGRPHYHCLLWNFPYKVLQKEPIVTRTPKGATALMLPLVGKWIYNHAWKKQGYVTAELCSNNGASFYLGKYIGKPTNLPSRTIFKDVLNPETGELETKEFHVHALKNFRLSSKGSKKGVQGGIGAPYLDSVKELLRANPRQDVKYLTPDGQLKTYRLGAYAIRRVFPTIARALPKEVRDDLTLVQYDFGYLLNHFGEYFCTSYELSQYQRLTNIVPRETLIQTIFYEDTKSDYELTFRYERMKQKVELLLNYFLGKDWHVLDEIAKSRIIYFEFMSRNRQLPVSSRAYKARKSRAKLNKSIKL